MNTGNIAQAGIRHLDYVFAWVCLLPTTLVVQIEQSVQCVCVCVWTLLWN